MTFASQFVWISSSAQDTPTRLNELKKNDRIAVFLDFSGALTTIGCLNYRNKIYSYGWWFLALQNEFSGGGSSY
jgi:hypothetical protein